MAKQFQRTGTPKDVHQVITDKIVGLLEKGVKPWSQPWVSRDFRPQRHNGKPYNGINVLILWATGIVAGYTNPRWMTFKQAKELGGWVRKGEKGAEIVFYNRYTKNAGSDDEQIIPVLRSYVVFNVEQIADLPDEYYAKGEALAVNPSNKRNPVIDRFFESTGLKIVHRGDRAFYQIATHTVNMPSFTAFHSSADYYGTLAHECVHATKHPSLLDRTFGQQRFGDEGYAMEELVAELGAAFLGADLGLWVQPREDHASYLGHWLKVLKSDKKAIFTAASAADKAVAKLHEMATGAVSGEVDDVADDERDYRVAA